MPRHAASLLRWMPESQTYEMHVEGVPAPHVPVPGTDSWSNWLDETASFSFHSRAGVHCTIRKETMQRGGAYWYSYQRVRGRVVKRYIGKSSELTIARLEEVAGAFTSEKLPVNGESIPVQLPETLPTQAQAPLLEPKLHLPRLHVSLVSRERLLAQLDEGLSHKLTLISAPAESGKTTLVRQWMAERNAQQRQHVDSGYLPPVAWVSLDAGDNDPIRFWRYVITACRVLQQDLGQPALAQLSTLPQIPFKSSPLEASLTTFLNALTQCAQRGILVLEDYHFITEAQIHETVTFFLDHLPTTLHLMILTGSDPPLPLARLRAKGDLYEVRSADLRFSQKEAATSLQQTIPLPISEKAIKHLNAHVEGWAAGLRLLALALQGRTNRQQIEHILANFAGNHRPLQEYFVAEVLSAQPEPLQDFLLQTSVLNRLTSSLCDAIMERQDSQQLLEALERSNLFLEALDESGEWYRYHALFAESMQTEARRRLGIDILRTVSHKASVWFEQRGLLAEAIEAALQAENMERTATLIEEMLLEQYFLVDTRRFQEVHGFHTLRRWLEQLPETVLKQHPALCLSYAITLLFVSILDQVPFTQANLVQLEEALQVAEQSWRREGNTRRLAEVFAFRALVTRRQGAIREAITWATQALAWLPADEAMWRSTCLSVLGIGELLEGRLDLAKKALQEAIVICEALENRTFARANMGMLSWVYSEQGELNRACEYFRQLLIEAREEPDNDDICHALIALAQLSYERNELQIAEQQAHEALDLSHELADEGLRVQATLVLARVLYAQGQKIQAQQRLSELLVSISSIPATTLPSTPLLYQFLRETQAQQVRFHLADGNLHAVQPWWVNESTDRGLFPSSSGKALQIAHRQESGTNNGNNRLLTQAQQEREEQLVARWLLAQGKTEEALDILDRLLDSAQKAQRVHSALEIQVLMALAYASRHEMQKARELLQAILPLAHKEGYTRLFLDEGEAMAALLRMLLPNIHDKPLSSYVRFLLSAFDEQQSARTSSTPQSRTPAWLVEPLSPQEERVLRLLVAERCYPEIACELVVSVNTVKTQVRSIYRKLNVNSRREARAVASQWNFL
jgi:LuxR family transcriptional regulator, maltose regulon positive regulatory protein